MAPPPSTLPQPQFTRAQNIDRLLAAVDADELTCAMLAVAVSSDAQVAFGSRVMDVNIPPEFPRDILPADFFPVFMSWAGQIGSIARPISAPSIVAAMAYRTLQKRCMRWSKEHFIETALLNPQAVDKGAFIQSIPRHDTDLLRIPYPTESVWIAETGTILEFNRRFIQQDPLHDARDWRRPIELLDASRIQLDIGPTESARIYDSASGCLVGMVVRDVCKNEEAVHYVDSAVERMVESRVTSRVSNGSRFRFLRLRRLICLPRKETWGQSLFSATLQELGQP